jgi:hypothetical protein
MSACLLDDQFEALLFDVVGEVLTLRVASGSPYTSPSGIGCNRVRTPVRR